MEEFQNVKAILDFTRMMARTLCAPIEKLV